MVPDAAGNLYITGRYRNFGDSRTGVGAGVRGLELAIFKSEDQGTSWSKVKSFTKQELNVGDWEVLSIEGTALHFTDRGVELFISSEKLNRPFVEGYEHFHKPGTGSWTMEVMSAPSVEELSTADYKTVMESRDPRWFNVKDPFFYKIGDGDLVLGYCTHPFNWASSNTGYAVRKKGESHFGPQNNSFLPRGFCWDVGIARGTAFLQVPSVGAFSEEEVSLLFYDGGEAMRSYAQHDQAVVRPRGHSCEELGGLAFFRDGNLDQAEKLSIVTPAFVSPWGTGCSRYVDVLQTEAGFYTTWQQSQEDGSQPLVMTFLPMAEAEALLSE